MKPVPGLSTLLLVATLACPINVKGEPLVLHDNGQTTAIEPFLEPLRPKPKSDPQLPPTPSLSLGNYGLPVETPSITPGKVASRSLPKLQGKMAAARPLFLVGADQWSLQWLQQNRARLAELQAVGMVVAVHTESDLDILRQAAGALPLMPASGEALARRLGLRHYPVLIAPPGMIAQ